MQYLRNPLAVNRYQNTGLKIDNLNVNLKILMLQFAEMKVIFTM